jgi:hypothetical protein
MVAIEESARTNDQMSLMKTFSILRQVGTDLVRLRGEICKRSSATGYRILIGVA